MLNGIAGIHGTGVAPTPVFPAGITPRVWLDGADTTTYTLNGSTVSEWRDKSANTYAFTQATASAQPTRVTSGLNGFNTISWDGNDRLVSTAAASTWKFFSDGTDYLFCFVGKFQTQTGYLLILDAASSGNVGGRIIWNTDASLNHSVLRGVSGTSAVNNSSAVSSYASNTFKNVGVLADPDNATAANRSSIKINNGSSIANNTQTNAVSASNPASTWFIGAYLNDGTTDRMIGEIAEIVVCTGAQATDANRTTLYNYLNTKWGV